jgi:transposase InsO family protein
MPTAARNNTSWVFGHRLRAAGLPGSMGRVASSVDNALIESFWSTMQRELLDRRAWSTRVELASAIFEWIEGWYNPAAGTPASACSPRTTTKPLRSPSRGREPFQLEATTPS